MLRTFMPVFIDEHFIVEAEFRLIQQGVRGPVILRLLLCKFCHFDFPFVVCHYANGKAGAGDGVSPKGNGQRGTTEGRNGAGRAVD